MKCRLLLTVALLSALCPAMDFAADLQPLLGTQGPLLRKEKFEAPDLPKGWTIKNGNVRVADGTLRASQNIEAGRLFLFHCEQSMQDAAIQIDFKFAGARGINVSANPSPGEIQWIAPITDPAFGTVLITSAPAGFPPLA